MLQFQPIGKIEDRTHAKSLSDSDARQVLKASTHWLRHSHAAHALNGREGHEPVPLEVFGTTWPPSIATTSSHLTGERDARLRHGRRLGQSKA